MQIIYFKISRNDNCAPYVKQLSIIKSSLKWGTRDMPQWVSGMLRNGMRRLGLSHA